MNVRDYILTTVKKRKMHMTLLDPDKQSSERAAEITVQAQRSGTDAIMIGGSTGLSFEKVDDDVKAIKRRTSIPVILFPSDSKTLSEHADALYFMSLMNSRNLDFVIREHAKAAPFIKTVGLETISMGYIIVAPGGKAGQVGEADLIPRNEPEKALGYALAAEMLGMDLVYLEAGSGAKEPVPAEMISLVKRQLSIPLVVGGGIRSAELAREIANAGADIIVTGTVVEGAVDVGGILKEIIAAVKGE